MKFSLGVNGLISVINGWGGLVCLLALFSLSACAYQPVKPTRYEQKKPDKEKPTEVTTPAPHTSRSLNDKIARLKHEDPIERAWAAHQLSKQGPSAAAAITPLVNLLADDTPVLLSRYLGGGYHSSSATTPGDEAARALGKMNKRATVPLIFALKDKNPNVRRLAAKALGQIGDIKAIEFLLPLLNDEDRGVRATTVLALGNYRNPIAATRILDMLPEANPVARADMIYALAQINDLIVVKPLIELLPNEPANVRAAIVYALGKLRDARALEVLIKSLNDEDEIVRANAAYSLSEFYDPRVIDILIKAIGDDTVQVREAAEEALRRLTGMNFGMSQENWQAWWNQQKSAMNPAKDSSK